MGVTYTDQASVIPLLVADVGISDVQAGLLPTALFISAVATMLATASLADPESERFRRAENEDSMLGDAGERASRYPPFCARRPALGRIS